MSLDFVQANYDWKGHSLAKADCSQGSSGQGVDDFDRRQPIEAAHKNELLVWSLGESDRFVEKVTLGPHDLRVLVRIESELYGDDLFGPVDPEIKRWIPSRNPILMVKFKSLTQHTLHSKLTIPQRLQLARMSNVKPLSPDWNSLLRTEQCELWVLFLRQEFSQEVYCSNIIIIRRSDQSSNFSYWSLRFETD